MELENVQAGDKLICVRWYGHRKEVVTVDRVTRTQIIIGSECYRKQDGLRIGCNTWSRVHVRLPWEGEIEEIVREHKCQDMRYEINRMSADQNLCQLPYESIERIYNVMVDEYAGYKINSS